MDADRFFIPKCVAQPMAELYSAKGLHGDDAAIFQKCQKPIIVGHIFKSGSRDLMISRLAFVIPRLVSECLVDGARDSLMSPDGIEALHASSVLFVLIHWS